MLFFWVLAGLLTCSATALLVWPLIGRRDIATTQSSDDEARRLAVYRDRKREIERERDAGRLTPTEAEQALRELVADASRQFPSQVPAPAAGTKPGRSSALPWAAAAALLVPAVALTVYFSIGAPGVVALEPEALRGELSPERIAQAVRELHERVARNPDDGEGWAMLAEAHRLNNDPAKAAPAYEKATGLLPPNARLLADYAETLVILAKGDFAGRPVQLLERALRADPEDGKAIALMGAAQYRLGNLEEALRHLKSLDTGDSGGTGQSRQLSEAIARIEGELAARKTGTAPLAAAVAATGQAARPAQSSTSATVSGIVAIDDALRAQVARGAVLFIAARSPEGSRVPIAALRLPVGTAWPVRFELGDAQSMDPSRTLSQAESVVIEARISASGDAIRKSGDPYGVSAPVRPGAREVDIRIDRRVP